MCCRTVENDGSKGRTAIDTSRLLIAVKRCQRTQRSCNVIDEINAFGLCRVTVLPETFLAIRRSLWLCAAVKDVSDGVKRCSPSEMSYRGQSKSVSRSATLTSCLIAWSTHVTSGEHILADRPFQGQPLSSSRSRSNTMLVSSTLTSTVLLPCHSRLFCNTS
jgi:hypothetical protein